MDAKDKDGTPEKAEKLRRPDNDERRGEGKARKNSPPARQRRHELPEKPVGRV
jgi:hypothetical protein